LNIKISKRKWRINKRKQEREREEKIKRENKMIGEQEK
jgi:hypothetical protein